MHRREKSTDKPAQQASGTTQPVFSKLIRKGPAIRVLQADDHTVVRDGLSVIIDQEPGMQVVAQAANGRQAVEL